MATVVDGDATTTAATAAAGACVVGAAGADGDALSPLVPRPSFDYKGVPVPWWFHTQTADYVHELELEDDDIVLATIAKAGTHWTHSIIRKVIEAGDTGRVSEHVPDFKLTEMYPMTKAQTPAIMTKDVTFPEHLATHGAPKVICTHLLPHCLPKSLKVRGKLVYVLRNPKDALVSLYYFNGEAKDGWGGCAARYMDPNTRNPFGTFTRAIKAFTPLIDELGDRAIVIYYEDLKRDFEGTVAKARSEGQIECAMHACV